jgi:uncharacterized protein (DUF1330 family)
MHDVRNTDKCCLTIWNIIDTIIFKIFLFLILRGAFFMSCFFIAQIHIEDKKEFQKYLDELSEVFSKFNGKYLAIDDNPEVLEGSWTYSRIVIIEFESKKELKRWYESQEYQEVLKYRLNASKCDTILVKGLE